MTLPADIHVKHEMKSAFRRPLYFVPEYDTDFTTCITTSRKMTDDMEIISAVS